MDDLRMKFKILPNKEKQKTTIVNKAKKCSFNLRIC